MEVGRDIQWAILMEFMWCWVEDYLRTVANAELQDFFIGLRWERLMNQVTCVELVQRFMIVAIFSSIQSEEFDGVWW